MLLWILFSILTVLPSVVSKTELIDGSLYFPDTGITMTVYGHAMIVESPFILDVVGKVDLNTGTIGNYTILTAAYGSDSIFFGFSGFDYVTNQIYFSNDNAAFGSSVFSADMNRMIALPPETYYLDNIAYLGYDPVTGSRVIGGQMDYPFYQNYLILEQPNFGDVKLYAMQSDLYFKEGTEVFDGHTNNFYIFDNVNGLVIWNAVLNQTSYMNLACVPGGHYAVGTLYVSPSDPSIIFGLIGSNLVKPEVFSLIRINLSAKNCTIVGALPNLDTVIDRINSVQYGHLSGNIVVSVDEELQMNSINVYDQSLNQIAQVYTNLELLHIFVQEETADRQPHRRESGLDRTCVSEKTHGRVQPEIDAASGNRVSGICRRSLGPNRAIHGIGRLQDLPRRDLRTLEQNPHGERGARSQGAPRRHHP